MLQDRIEFDHPQARDQMQPHKQLGNCCPDTRWPTNCHRHLHPTDARLLVSLPAKWQGAALQPTVLHSTTKTHTHIDTLTHTHTRCIAAANCIAFNNPNTHIDTQTHTHTRCISANAPTTANDDPSIWCTKECCQLPGKQLEVSTGIASSTRKASRSHHRQPAIKCTQLGQCHRRQGTTQHIQVPHPQTKAHQSYKKTHSHHQRKRSVVNARLGLSCHPQHISVQSRPELGYISVTTGQDV